MHVWHHEQQAVNRGGTLLRHTTVDDAKPPTEPRQGPHVVACGIMRHLLRLAEAGRTPFVRQDLAVYDNLSLAARQAPTTSTLQQCSIITDYITLILLRGDSF